MTEPHFLDTASPAFSTRSDEVRAARAAHWCARTPYGVAVLSHREVGRLLRDRRLRQGSHSWPDRHGMTGAFADFWSRSVIGREGPQHKTLRRLANDALSPAFVESLAPQFDAAADRLAAALGLDIEFMADFASAFSGHAITALLSIDDDRWREVCSDASDLGLAMGVECKRHEARVNAACERLTALAAELAQRARTGGDDGGYVARLVQRFDAAEDVGETELLDMIVISIFGGVDTTRSLLGNAMTLFAAAPDQWARLRANPALAPATVEEAIRAYPTTTWATREALEDFEHEGVAIKRGETLHLFVHASARDPAICGDPHFDIEADRKAHFGFGGGAHHCLGHQMARTDMAAALRSLAQRIESFEISGEAEYLPDSGNTGPVRLPLRLTFAD